jgi:hypothetical protein
VAKADAVAEQLRPAHDLKGSECQTEDGCGEQGLFIGFVVVAEVSLAHLHDGIAGGEDDDGIGVKDLRKVEVVPDGACRSGEIAKYEGQEGRRDTEDNKVGLYLTLFRCNLNKPYICIEIRTILNRDCFGCH